MRNTMILLTIGAVSFLFNPPVTATIHVVIISGQNNHNWQQTTPALVQLLEQHGNFTVDIDQHSENLTADKLNKYDVIVSNYNTFGSDATVKQWPKQAQQAYTEFIRQGHGHVVVHAGGSSFYDWPEYHQIAASWAEKTKHGPVHEFRVCSTGIDHPITKNFSTFTTTDELWNNTQIPAGSQILMEAYSAPNLKGGSREHEPLLAVSHFGKGRCVNFMLGHDVKTMANPGFQFIFLRSVEWAAIGSVSQKSAVDTASTNVPAFNITDHSAAMTKNGNVVWQFNYGKNLSKPSFHPVALVDGTILTWDAPPDHPWHHGLWFSWKYINGLNYWEEDPTGKSAGRTEWTNVDIQTHSDGSARITMDLSYHEPNQPALLTEKRLVEISAPDNTGCYSMDWTSEFTAEAENVVLDRTPPTGSKDGSDWGGYAGLSVRLSKDVQAVLYTGTQGPISIHEGVSRCNAAVVECSGIVNDKPFGMAILDHPKNLNSPVSWYLVSEKIRYFSYFSPAVICYAPLVMSKGQMLALRYRIFIHPGKWEPAKLKEKVSTFSNGE